MAPIVDHQAAVAADHTVAHLTIIKREKDEEEHHPTTDENKNGQLLGDTSITTLAKDNFRDVVVDDDDDTRDEHEHAAAAAIFRIGETSSNNASSSLFMDEGDNYTNSIFTEDAAIMMTSSADLKHSALMTSFDAMEDIDLSNSMSSPTNDNISKEQLQELQHSIITATTDSSSSSSAAILFSTDEELARQLQAEEDEYARQQRDIFRTKAQKQKREPPRKLKKSWLDNLIGEPFPSEIKRNYAKSSSSNSPKNSSSGLMKAIAAAEARVTSAAIDSSILVDRTHTTTSCTRGSNVSSSSSSSINVDESINQLSTSISKWWSSNVVINPNIHKHGSDDNDGNNDDEDDGDGPTTSKEEDLPTFIDNGSEGYYTGDFLTNNNTTPIQPLQRHGQGIMTYKSGNTFTGNFQNNTFHGWGIYLWADGDKQRGTWQRGLRHGPCVFHHAASDTIEYGYYEQGKVVGEGVRLNGDRTKAWKLMDGKRVLLEEEEVGIIEMEEAERIVAERFECFPIPVAVKKKKNEDEDKGI